MTATAMMDGMIDLALRAGEKICSIYDTDFDKEIKGDGSPVTEADQLAEDIILAGLKEIAPDIPVLAEESAAAGKIPELGDKFFLVDPLDGTKEFINKTGEFTVNIALIENGRPVAGVVYAPAAEKLYFGTVGEGAFIQKIAPGADRADALRAAPINVRKRKEGALIAVASRSHRSAETETLLEKLGATDFTPAGSSLKFCLVAEGLADVYPRLGRTMEWDTGAGQAVLEAAGGSVNAYEGEEETGPLGYGKKERGFDNPYFIAWGGQ
ncbi:3'(2'),5'-bisphosphate nucleotidase CysQ [Aquisalinus luteolus]|uniref:3'(2'),5'-bisphosphate nucleotidase CysQ n=2 Tax=Aquisalinus luteolus TaxID=1566827 RepID=A0A8J3AAJ1_9PROT|nr:3'(2'),5'-bisphosphate nucleotidase CysQ [Aquisalinus luteolus]GGI01889.1 3'(2'),5'-bisphosphate nucleotidase CysQ [Aquisalinus luteolus]